MVFSLRAVLDLYFPYFVTLDFPWASRTPETTRDSPTFEFRHSSSLSLRKLLQVNASTTYLNPCNHQRVSMQHLSADIPIHLRFEESISASQVSKCWLRSSVEHLSQLDMDAKTPF